MSWCTIESDPGVFTELISKIGVKGIQVEELYSLDSEVFAELKPVYGLIFLFKWKPTKDEEAPPMEYYNPDLFFANQVINNACATQAILSILMNCPPEIDLGTELSNFKAFTKDLPSEVKGLAISNSDLIREVHNSFSRPEPFVVEEQKATKDDDVYHFIAYLPFQGAVWELDGLKQGPVRLAECSSEDDWTSKVAPAIQARIQEYATHEIRFNLMALVRNKRDALSAQLESLEAEKAEVDAQAMSLEGSAADSEQVSALKSRSSAIEAQMREAKQKMEFEEHKYKTWKAENMRRRHNYIPFIMNMLRFLAEKNELVPLVQKALERQKAHKDARAAGKSSESSEDVAM